MVCNLPRGVVDEEVGFVGGEMPEAEASKIYQTHVERAVVFFVHCFRVEEPPEMLRQKLRIAGYVEFNCINPDPARPNLIYFEQEVYDLFRHGAFKPKAPLSASAVENRLPLQITPIVYVLPFNLLFIALRVEFAATPQKPRLYPVMRFVEAFRNCILRHFQAGDHSDRQVEIALSPEARQLGFDEGRQIAEAFHLVTKVFRLTTGREVREKGPQGDIVFGNFAKLFASLFYKLDGELTPQDRHQIHHFDRPFNPEKPEDWHDPLPHPSLINDFREHDTYRRWLHQKQYFGFMPFGFTMFLEPDAERARQGMDGRLPFYFEHRYHVLYLVLLAKLAFLQSMKDRLMRIEAEIRNGKRNAKDKIIGRITALREELLNFSNTIWSSRLSYEIQPSELYELGHRSLHLDKQYDEVHQKLTEYDEYLKSWEQGQINKGLWILQWLLMPLAIGGFFATLMQLKAVTDWLAKTFIAPWPEILQVAIPLILPVPLVAVVYAIYRKVRSWKDNNLKPR
jgi:hypothetical protein